MSDRIPLREFNQYTHKYIKPGKVILTKNGKNKYVVTIEDIDNVATIAPEKPKNVATIKNTIKNTIDKDREYRQERHGCGCKKGDTNLCSKHMRF